MIRPKTCASGRNSSVEPSALNSLLQPVGGRHHVEEQVAVGQLAALGPAGGAAGVDDRRQVVGPYRGAALLGLLVRHVPAEPGEGADRVVVDRPHLPQVGQLRRGPSPGRRGARRSRPRSPPRRSRRRSTAPARRWTSRRSARSPRRRTRSRSRAASTRSGCEPSARPGRRPGSRRRSGRGRRRRPRAANCGGGDVLPAGGGAPAEADQVGQPPGRCRRPCRSAGRRRAR